MIHEAAPAPTRVSPELGSVIFASATQDWSFSLTSFAIYADLALRPRRGARPAAVGRRLLPSGFAHLLRKAPEAAGRAPLCSCARAASKLVTQTISAPEPELKATLAELGISMGVEFKLDPKPMLRVTLSRFFGSSHAGLTQALVDHLPSAQAGAVAKVEHAYSGLSSDACVEPMRACDPNGLLMVNVTRSP